MIADRGDAIGDHDGKVAYHRVSVVDEPERRSDFQ